MEDVFSYLDYGQPSQLLLQNTPPIKVEGTEKDLGFIDIFRDRTSKKNEGGGGEVIKKTNVRTTEAKTNKQK